MKKVKKTIDSIIQQKLDKLDDPIKLDRTFNKIINSNSKLISKETLLKDFYSSYKDEIKGDKLLRKEKRKLEHDLKYKSKPKKKKKSTIKGVYYNSIKKQYCVLLSIDGTANQQHFGFYKSLVEAEEHCIELKQQHNIQD